MAETTYDYVIVGSGSAGSTLAGRLGADASLRICVLEAGGTDWNPLIHIPFGTGKLLRSKLHGWGYNTEPDPELGGRSTFWPRGRVVGGSSSINSMLYVRGHRLDYDTWAQLGNRGWSYADVLPYFRRAEGHDDRRDAFHGRDGPIGVRRGGFENPLYGAFQRAGAEAGHPPTDDFNGASQEGVGTYDFTIRGGRRCSAAVAYLHPARKRGNVELITGAQATRVLFEDGRAVGVEYLKGGSRRAVGARREVVLAGGTLNSPQLLMLSGIGDGEALGAHGIETRVHLPGVGRNLQDHVDVMVRHLCTENVTLHSMTRFDRVAVAMLRAGLFGAGPAATFPAEAGAFLRTRPELAAPDIQLVLLLGLGTTRIRWPLVTALRGDPLEREGFTCRVCVLRPESRGEVRLASADPLARVKIQANYLAAETDRATLVAGVRVVRDFLAQPAFDRFRGAEFEPGPGMESDREIEAWVRTAATTIYHPVGTAKMGGDEMAVVDDHLRVRGVEGLRVVDASIMPTLIAGNTNAPTVMIAEKAADMLLDRPALAAEDPEAPSAAA